VNSKIAIAAATSALLLGSTAVAQTTTTTTTTDPAATTTGSAPNVSGDLNSQLTVAPAQGPVQATSTQSTIATGSTRTTTNVTVQPKAAPVATGAGEVQAGERG
jgi:hypothetical protein